MTQGEALNILKSGANVFLTGEPGSGKTHTIRSYITYLRSCGIEPAITASTGIAATHIGGMTIHSWSGIGIKKTISPYDLDHLTQNERLVSRLSKARTLIIDEISMLEAETFNSVERVLRTLRGSPDAFGGLQVVVVGDFFQLPPVSRAGESPYRFAFESPAWANAGFIPCYLSEQHRQDDSVFLGMLAKLRSGTPDSEVERTLQSRKTSIEKVRPNATKLYSHNVDVDRINAEKLAGIDAPLKTYAMSSSGGEHLVQFLRKSCLSPEILQLKEGASVIFTKNNMEGGYVNGTLGTVSGFDPDTQEPIVKTKAGKKIVASRAEWVIEDSGKKLATISQIPLRLAWAITIHKSQGMTLDNAVMDLSQTFEYGQGYVALSRVRTLSGLEILGWNRRSLEVHPKIREKDTHFKNASRDGSSVFREMSKSEVELLHKNFALSQGGSWPPNKNLAKQTMEKEKQVSTADKTLELLKAGMHQSVALLAKARGLTEGTIVTHLEALQKSNKLEKKYLDQLFGKDKKIQKIAKETKDAFKKIGDASLTPVFKAFGGKYSFEELRIARIILKSK